MIPPRVHARLIEIAGWSPDVFAGAVALMRHESEPECFARGEGNFADMRCPYRATQRPCCGTAACSVHHECPAVEAQP